jgi:hypothetical protein
MMPGVEKTVAGLLARLPERPERLPLGSVGLKPLVL